MLQNQILLNPHPSRALKWQTQIESAIFFGLGVQNPRFCRRRPGGTPFKGAPRGLRSGPQVIAREGASQIEVFLVEYRYRFF